MSILSRLLTVFFCFCSVSLCARTVIIGNGSGSVSKKDMKGLHPGDTLAIEPGLYFDGGSFSHLNNITITNHKGVVHFGKAVFIGHLSNVTITGTGAPEIFYGFQFTAIEGDAFVLENKCTGLKIFNFEYSNVKGVGFNASIFFTKYNGDTSTFSLYKTTIANLHLLKSGPLFVGSWSGVTTFQNVVDSIAFYNIIIDSTISDVIQVEGNSIYRLLAHDWTIKGGCPNGRHDAGIFQMNGNGTLYNIYRYGGWGYLWRIWNVGLNGRADSYIYNCIDLATDSYGTIDTRMEAGDTTTYDTIPFTRGGNMHVFNNTSGNKRNVGGYVSVLVVAGTFFSQSGYNVEVRNNLCFNNKTDNAYKIIKQNSTDILKDTSNNLYSENPIEDGILIDTKDCFLADNSPAIDSGITIPIVKADFAGIIRPKGSAYDRGAREYTGNKSVPLKKKSDGWKIFVFGSIVLIILILIALLVARLFARLTAPEPKKKKLRL